MQAKKAFESVHPFLISQRFQEKGRLYWKREDDVLFCICFDAPSSLLYCQYFVMPLYIPFFSVTYTFGKRMETKLSCPDGAPTVEAVNNWCRAFQAEYKRTAAPFFARFRRHPSRCPGCMKIDAARLDAFTAVYRAKGIAAKIALARYRRELRKCTLFSREILDARAAEAQALAALLGRPARDAEAYFEDVIQKNLTMLKLQ